MARSAVAFDGGPEHRPRIRTRGLALCLALGACSLDERMLSLTGSDGYASRAGSGASGGASGDGGATSGEPTAAGSGGEAYDLIDLDADGVSDREQTLVRNASFDRSARGWELEPFSAQAHSPRDSQSDPSSGSVSVASVGRLPRGTDARHTGSYQCIAVEGGKTYTAHALLFIASGHGEGEGALAFTFFEGEGCRGSVLGSARSQPVERTEAWTPAELAATAPPASASVRVGLAVAKPPAADYFELLFDSVLVKPAR